MGNRVCPNSGQSLTPREPDRFGRFPISLISVQPAPIPPIYRGGNLNMAKDGIEIFELFRHGT